MGNFFVISVLEPVTYSLCLSLAAPAIPNDGYAQALRAKIS